VFFPGTGGRPDNVMPLLQVAAKAGYRVIGLSYNDEPAVDQVCPKHKEPACPSNMRQRRIYGDTKAFGDIDDRPEESMVNRLTKLIQYLVKTNPGEGWDGYLSGSDLNWSRLALSGHSQGGGMAAFMAKSHAVARVVTFSGGWDRYNAGGRLELASWYRQSSATPAANYWGTYHEKEEQAALIATSYKQMGIPPDHIRLTTAPPKKAGNYHPSVVGNAENRDIWAFLIGTSP
jgi:hypothetical protein